MLQWPVWVSEGDRQLDAPPEGVGAEVSPFREKNTGTNICVALISPKTANIWNQHGGSFAFLPLKILRSEFKKTKTKDFLFVFSRVFSKICYEVVSIRALFPVWLVIRFGILRGQ